MTHDLLKAHQDREAEAITKFKYAIASALNNVGAASEACLKAIQASADLYVAERVKRDNLWYHGTTEPTEEPSEPQATAASSTQFVGIDDGAHAEIVSQLGALAITGALDDDDAEVIHKP